MTENSPLNSAALTPSMAEALARLWKKFLPDIEARVTVLEATAHAIASGTLSDEEREEAHAAAHKLSGTLGTFGLHRGTKLARECEDFLAGEQPLTPAFDLCARAAELKALIKSHD
jgi:HPt (histidine-containing phosphotransfer) domain-containing protein